MSLDDLVRIGQSEKVPVDILDFDVNNPRFTPDKRPDTNSDASVAEKLASSADLAELVQSIATSGYINIEPLIVIERANRLAVLEGNRRLAAVKVLRDPELARKAKITLPPMSDVARSSMEQLLVYRVADEADARDLIGFKHINGPQAWDAFAKARFAARWLDAEHEKVATGQNGLTLGDIAGRMGDQHMTIHRMVTGLFVLEQAERNDVYQVDDRRKKSFSFSHLYTGLSYEEFTNYLGMPRPDRAVDPARNPVPEYRFGELRKLLVWLYGSKADDVQPVVKSQNPDLNTLRMVLSSSAAIKVLEERGDLAEAEVTATPKAVRFEQSLINANAELQHAVLALEGFDPNSQPEMVQIADSALRKARLIKSQLDIEMDAASPEGGSSK